jgi:hypothetical protein
VVHAVADWCGGGSTAGRLLLLVVVALLAFGLFGRPVDARHVELDLRGRAPGRMLATLTLGTLLVAVTVNQVVGGAWQDRYTAVAFVSFLLWAGLGVRSLSSPRLAVGVVGLAAVLGLVVSASNVTTDRTNANVVASAIRTAMQPGDVVATCPDQLGPALSRELPMVRVLGVPTLEPAARVDWVDYAKRQQAAQPAALAARLSALAGPTHRIFFVVSHGYLTYEPLCTRLQQDLQSQRRPVHILLQDDANTGEHSALLDFGPV